MPRDQQAASSTAYYDTSGAQRRDADGDVMVTVGIAASETQWRGFDRDWTTMLSRAGVPYLHMRDAARAFSHRPTERDRCFDDAVRIIRKRAMQCFVVTVSPAEYRRADAEFTLTESLGGAFGLCAGSCAVLVDKWFRTSVHPTRSFRHAHEAGDDMIGRAQTFARKYNVALESQSACENGVYHRPFEANDFIAWEIRRAWETIVRKPGDPLRSSVVSIALGIKAQWHLWSYELLREKGMTEGLQRRT